MSSSAANADRSPSTTERTKRGDPVVLGEAPLTVEDVVAVAHGRAELQLSPDPSYRDFLDSGPAFLQEYLSGGGRVYGVTTGFGDSCVSTVDGTYINELPANLVRFHGCGVGPDVSPVHARAVVAVRAASLAAGYSGVRSVLVDRLVELLRHGITPRIPVRGSVGASGDLTPLSYVAAVLMGEREVWWRGESVPAQVALDACGIAPLRLEPKEGLALMNGTTLMTAYGCLAFAGAERIARAACALTAMASDVMQGNPGHFHDRLFALKPHPGMRQAAMWIRDDLYLGDGPLDPDRIQDRYSIRCAPHVVGVLLDVLPVMRSFLEVEVNGATDNPLIDPETRQILHGGHFYGGHACFALDTLKNTVANIADLLERQLLLLCNDHTSNGLPVNLVAPSIDGATAHHGFKAMQITASALTAEALKTALPASVFSRSTENHNQDKVSMGAIAARECAEVIELTETVVAIAALALCQAVDLRGQAQCGHRAQQVHRAVRAEVPMNTGDRRQDGDIAAVLTLLREDRLGLDG